MQVKNDVVSLLRTAREYGISVFSEDNALKLKIARNQEANPEIIALLKANKQEILDFLSDGMGNMEQIKKIEEEIRPFNRHEIKTIPPSFSQEQLWFIDQLEGSVKYHQPLALRLKIDLNRDVLESALFELLDRHEVLRTVIREENGKPYQFILPASGWKMDFHESPSFTDESYLTQFIESEFARPFDLANDYMLRATLAKIRPEEYVLILVMHHIASDGWSKSILVKDLATLYSAKIAGNPAGLPPLPIQYADFAVWQRNRLTGAYLEAQLDWWKENLKGLEMLKLPTDYPYPPVQSIRGANEKVRLDPELAEALKALSLKTGATLFMTMLAAFNVLLYRYSGQEDICVGTPLANRNRKEIESLVGFFINSLALRNNLSGNPTFSAFLEQVKSNTLSAFSHQEIPFEQIVRKVAGDRSLHRSPLFQVMFVIQNIPEIPALDLGGMDMSDEQTGFIASKYELTFVINDQPGNLSLEMVYCKDLFMPATIRRLLGHYEELLKAIATNPDEKIDRLSLTTESERKSLLIDFNRTAISYPKDKSIIRHFENQADQTPDHPALVFKGATISYAELDKRSTQLARLLMEKGIRIGDKVGILSSRGFDMMVSIFAVLKSGAIYVPLNTAYPSERLQYILKDAAISFILCGDEKLAEKSGLSGVERINPDQAAAYEANRIGLYPGLEAGAYVMYTSGTTGEPKGILVNQQNILKLAFETNDIAIHAGDRVLQWSNFSFDGSTYDIYNSLLNGASLYLIGEEDAPDAKKLSALIRENKITLIFITTALFNAFVDHDLSDLKSLRKILFGGELVSISHVKKALEVLGAGKIVHMYGPTETTVYATCYPIKDMESGKAPIGRPLSNTTAYVLNDAGQPAGIGVIGEIFIGGDGVSLGYLNQEKLNAEKFIDNPFSAEQPSKLYKTGDLARVLADGNIEFIGRKDTQVKIRGYRIELGEIEAVMRQCPKVNQGVVVVREDSTGTRQLVAYVVPEGPFDKESIQAFLRTKLPEYMTPSLMMPLEQLPLNPNGKIDKKALPEWDAAFASAKTHISPKTEKEKLIAGIWSDLLQIEKISVQDNFFELGGHSLLAMRMISNIRKMLHHDLSVRDVFLHPTIESLALHLENAGHTEILPTITAGPRPEKIPLSFSQERLWFIDQLGGSTQLHIPSLFRLKNELDKTILEAALSDLIARHEILRTIIRSEDGNAYQEVISAGGWRMDYSEGEHLQEEQSRKAFIAELIARPFDLSKDYMLRAHLIKCGENDHLLLLVMHHIASDGWSISILAEDLVAFYSARQEGRSISRAPLPVQYADYAIWQRRHFAEKHLEDQLNWWVNELQGVEPLALPTDFPRPVQQSTRGAGHVFYIEKPLTDDLKKLSTQSGATLYMTLLAAFNVLLQRYSGQEDICIGMPTANREQKELEHLVGFFINTLVLRCDLSVNLSFKELLEQVKTKTLSAFERQAVPFEKVVEKASPGRNIGYNPLFQVLMVLQNTPDAPELALGDLELSGEATESTTTQYDLAFSIRESSLGLKVAVTYRTDLFAPQTIQRMATHFHHILSQLPGSVEVPVRQIKLLSASEEEALIQKFNQTEVGYHRPKTLLAQFEAQMRETPDRIAAIFDTETLTYRQLEARANQWAHFLIDKGVKPGDIVGICLERSLDMITGIVAIFKAGAAYLPIDPRYPEARIAFLLEDAGVRHLLTHQTHLNKIPVADNRELICMDMSGEALKTFSDNPTEVASAPESVAYVIYTSGSTGEPKGVVMSHRGVVNQGHWAEDYFDLNSEDVVLQRTTFCFDPSVWEFFWPLSTGGKICFAAPGMEGDARYLVETIEQNKVTIVCLVPSMLSVFLQEVPEGSCPTLKRIICGGEILQKSQVLQCRKKLPHVKIYNIYGPTETAIHVSCFSIPDDPSSLTVIPIGKPLSNVRLFVTDDNGSLAPEGVTGELCIGGIQLAEGYLNQPELTREKFVRPAFECSGLNRIYRTGDLVRWLPDGNLEYIGRKDNQLKINGFRVELGEIEYLLNQSPEVRTAVVIAKKDAFGSNRLVAYIVPEKTFDKNLLEAFLMAKAPAHMVPAFWVEMKKIPLLPTGKVDKKALPEPDIAAQIAKSYAAPESAEEQTLARLWMEVLPVEKVGIDDNFFEIGGHSILAMRLVPAIRRAFRQEIKVGDVFKYPSIRKFAEFLESKQEEKPLPPLVSLERPEKIPLSYSQERLWFVDQLGGSTQFHIPSVLRLKNELDVHLLEAALKDLLHRHEVLRTTLKSDDEGIPYQEVMTADAWKMDISTGDAFREETHLNQFVQEVINRPFDLAADFLLRAHLIRCSEEDHVLVLVVHHIAADGWSVSLLIKDLTELYRARLENRKPDLPELPVQYADYAIWQRLNLSEVYLKPQLDWWEGQLRGVHPISLPYDFPRPARQSTRGAGMGFMLNPELTGKLKTLAAKSDATLFMTLLSVFKILLHRYSGQDDICIGTSLANRNHKELEGLAGFFINSLVLRSDLSGNPDFLTLLEKVKSTTLSAFAHQEVPFEQIVDRVESSRRDLSRTPVFQVLFTLQNTPEVPNLELGTVQLSPADAMGNERTLYDLSVYLTETPKGLRVGIIYCSDLFAPPTIEKMANHFQKLLEAVAGNPNQKINHIPMFTDIEEQQMLSGATYEEVDPKDRSIADLFEEQAGKTPDQIAVVFEGKTWTYQELNEKANRVAHHLQTTFQIQSNDLIGIMMESSEWAILAILAILKSGAAYVPVDVEHPLDRKKFLVKDTGIKALIVESGGGHDAPELGVSLFSINQETDRLDNAHDRQYIRRTKNAADLAYVIYTSGSTGQSKGVMISHRNLTNYVYGLFEKLDIQSCQTFGLMSTLSADLGNTVLYSALLSGGALHVFRKKTLTDAEAIQEYFRETPIDCIKIVPSHWQALETESGPLLPRQMVIFGGEALSLNVVAKIRAANPALEVINHYGPTEATIGKLMHRVNLAMDYTSIPIGRPFANSEVYVVDDHLNRCPAGVPGELLIGGEGIARGYLNRPELTAEKFIDNPFSKTNGSRLYRTGDLVRLLSNGNIEFLGRKDDQVKIRGHRVELGEIEHVLKTAASVNNCAVLAKPDEEGNLRLIAYIVPVPTTSEPFDLPKLQSWLAEKLPDFMMPAFWITLDALPLTSNGKVDRKALPEPVIAVQEKTNYQAPATKTEQVLAAIWMRLLKLDKVDIKDNFFEIGGHSLLAIRVVSAVRKELQLKPDIEDVFNHPTLEAFAAFLDQNQSTGSLPPLTAAARPAKIPLSFAQERLWFIDQFAGSIQYHMPSVLRLKNKLDRVTLENALRDLVRRHEILRTIYLSEDGKPYQKIISAEEWSMAFSNDPAFGDAAYRNAFIAKEVNRPFDLSSDYMLRAHLIQCAEDDHILILGLHHIASDGWSTAILVHDLMEFYSARQAGRKPELVELPIQYADYAIWQRKNLSETQLESQLNWWEERLKGVETLNLPCDYPRPAIQSTRGASLSFHIEKELTEQLNNLSRQSGSTLFMTLITAFKVMMQRYSGQTDICIGAPLANRNHKEVEPLVGCFLNALILRSDLSGNPAFTTLLEQVKSTTLSAFKHQQVPFEQIVDRVENTRSLSRSPIFQVLFSLRNTPEVPDLELGTISLSSESSGQQISQLDLAFYVTESPKGLRIVILYCSDLFSEDTALRMAAHYKMLLQSVVSNPEANIHQLQMLPEAEKQQLLIELNNTTKAYPTEKTLVHLFEEQVLRTPDNLAVSFGSNSLTYRELNEQADLLSAYLKKTYQLQADDLIGVMTQRSDWAIVAMLGILKAGAAFVPIDDAYPKERKSFIIQDTGLKALIVQSDNLFDVVVGGYNVSVFAIDLQLKTLQGDPAEPHNAANINPKDLAYVIYTSGSTGNPKGVMVEHRGIANTILSQIETFGITESDRCQQFFSLSFDASVLEIFTALLSGAALQIIDDETKSTPDKYIQYLRNHNITIAALPPAYLNELNPSDLSGLKTLITGGDSAAPEKINEFLAFGNYCNSYGPTETSICATVYRVERGEKIQHTNIPLGRPVSNARIYLTDDAGNLVPKGAVGELCVGGAGLARGYLNNETMTDLKFIANPFEVETGNRLYKTGDLARWLPDNTLEFLGRKDDQVKIRGRRIEPGEIENALYTAKEVKDCAVVARPDQSGNLALVAYVVPVGQTTMNKSALQAHLSTRIPDYMVPALWVELESLPLTSTGKIDKNALPDPDLSVQSNQAFVGPRNEGEETLAKIWKELLHLEQVGIHDSFFALGGHSLLAVRLISSIKEAFALNIPLKVIFEFPTIDELYRYIQLIRNSENQEKFEASESFEL